MGGLATEQDIQDYLAYTIRINQLASSHEWVSMLRFNDKFRSLQAIYHLPWSHESSQLNLVTFDPEGLLIVQSCLLPHTNNVVLHLIHLQRGSVPLPPIRHLSWST